ncbi:MAG: Rieske 2Fe-2S domain-containing protein [Actinobacteria bacterium]|nr:Rieske 2Fe-2S domain-containing protein [Actinomycetota bacterium]
MSNWVRAVAVADIREGGARSFAYLDKRIALFRTARGVFASDNRCPHQGYALVRGDVKDGVLTCAWHNWKFELSTGTCRYGGENIRTYPVEIRDGQVFIDIADPPAEIIRPDLFRSLTAAMEDLDTGRMARDAMRLQRIGTPLADVIAEGVRYAAPRAEYGWDHSLATMTDCLRMSRFFEESLSALPVIQGLSLAADSQVRRPARPRPDPIDPVASYGSVGDALRAYPVLVDEERAGDAEALLRGLIAAGVPAPVLRHTLLTAVTDHFLAYGHSMIFVQKAFDLLDQIGWQEADAVLSPLVPEMVLGTRYDKLPYMRKFLRAWEAAEPDLALLARAGMGPDRAAPSGAGAAQRAAARPSGNGSGLLGYQRSLTDGSPDEALGALVRALAGGAPVTAVIDATGRAAAERLARFDIELDLDDTNDWGWLDVTHTLTYLNALRWAWSADRSPQVLRGLFHAAWFVQWTGQFDERNPGPARGRPQPHPTQDAAEVHRAIASRDPDAAVALADGYTGPRAELELSLIRAAAEDHSTAPIMVAHVVKTAQAAVEESRALGDGPGSAAPIAAAARFLASPKRERFVYQSTLEAITTLRGVPKPESDQVRPA